MRTYETCGLLPDNYWYFIYLFVLGACAFIRNIGLLKVLEVELDRRRFLLLSRYLESNVNNNKDLF